MASLVIGGIGAFVGSFFGPIGTSIGWSLGSALGNALFPTKTQQPLHDLHLQGSSYGAFIGIIYGTIRKSGNVIWETDLQEHDGGGKGKTPGQPTYTASFDVALCETPVVRVKSFFAAGRLNYDADQPDGPTVPFVAYDGNSAQLPDPTEEAKEGVGNVPAYRGISRVVFTDWDMTQFGNSIPQLSFVLETKGAAADLRITNANYATGRTISDEAIIQVWDADNIIVGDTTFSDSYTTTVTGADDYDLATLADDGSHTPPPTLSYPCYFAGPSPVYFGIGNYVYADGSTTPLFAYRNAPLTSSDTLPAIATQSLTAPYNGSVYVVHDTAKFLHTAGVPDAGYYKSSCLSQDGTALYIFTGPLSSGTIFDTWYKIVDSLVAATGTVTPNLGLNVWGVSGKSDGGYFNAMSAENDGEYFWYYQESGQLVNLYVIDGNGNFADWGGGTLNIPWSAGGTAASIKAIDNGTAGLAKGQSLVELSRIGAMELTYLSEVVADLCSRAGLDSSQYDVTQLAGIVVDGYTIEQQITVRAAIETLMPVYFFDAVESDGVLKFVVRGSDPIVEFLEDDLAAYEDGQDLPSVLSCVHTQDADLPTQLVIAYINASADYQINTQSSQRMIGGSKDVQTVQVPVVLTDQRAKQIVDAWLFNAYWERDAYTWRSSRKYCKYEPTDVCTIRGKVIRITKKTEGANGVITWEGVPSRAANFVQAGAGGSAFNQGQTLSPTVPTQLVLLDIPMIEDSDNQQGFYAAMAGESAGSFPGASLWKSSDGGSSYASVATAVVPATIGTVTQALGNFGGGNVFDESNVVTVTIGAGGGTLSSEPELAVLNGANVFLVGNEILQAKNCVLTAPSTYSLSGFLRGRRGTEAMIPLHAAGEQFVDLSTVVDVSAPFGDLGQTRLYKAVTLGKSLASGVAVSFVNYGAKLKPYSPAQLGGGTDASGNVTINWNRRTRIGGAWSDYSDVSLGEATEGYVLQIWNNHFQQVARIVTGLTSPTFQYTAAMQVADFGGTQQTIFVSVGQVGSYTLGDQATAQIPGIGASNGTPLNPQIPHNNPPPQTGSGCSGTVDADTLDWGTPTYIYSPDGFGGPDQTWLLSFTTGSIVSGRGRVEAFAGSGDQLPMGGKLTSEPCGQPFPPSKERLALSSLVQFYFYMTGNPSPGSIPTLLPSTTYYLCVTRPSVGAAMTAILYSPGN